MRPEDKPTNLWDIFAKYLGTYIRRAPAQDSKGKRDRYVLARDLVEKMKRRLNHTDSAEALPLEVYRLMSWAASDANIARDSVRWTEEWLLVLEKSDNKANAALMVLCKVRLSVLELKALRVAQVGKMVPGIDKLDFLEQKIAMMAEGLDNVSRGRKQDLEALLQEVGQLRRNALGLLTSLPHDGRKFGDSSDGDGSTRDAERKLRVLCDKAFRGVLRFCRKYMTMGIAEEEYTRLQAILTPAVDTVLSACLWGFSVEYSDAWENAEALLSECWSAVKGAERDRPGSMDTFYDKLSSVYWSIFLLYRKAPGSESRAVRALRKSISALDDRPAEELIKATITRRWEILGNVYLSARDYRRAEEAFLLAIKNAAFTGQLNELGERATNGEPIRQIFDSSDREAATIGAVLTGLVKIANKKQDRVASELRFEVEELSTSTRGCLLEWCFSLALDQMSEDGSLVRVIGERLIDVYEIEEMPIRRSRIISRLLELSVDHPGLLDSQEVRALGEECLEWANGVSASDLDEDKNLEGFRDDILARCCVGLGFSGWLDGNPRTDLFWTAFQLWDAIVKNEADWEKLSCRVDSLDEAIKRLDMMVEFFDMKGESELRLASLELLLELRKIEIPVNYNGKPCPSIGYSQLLIPI